MKTLYNHYKYNKVLKFNMKENQHLKNLQEILKNYQQKILMIY